MAKFFGKVGYLKTVEEPADSGIWKEVITEKEYYGDVIRNSSRFQSTSNLNDNIVISNNVSILVDPYAVENFQHIRYVEFEGTKWKVTNAEVQYPRILLTLGEVYNG